MKYKIAIIEDDELIRGMIEINLNKSKYEVFSFSNCEDNVLNRLLTDFDLIILDIMLPGITGLDFLKIIRNNQIFTPVLIISSKEDIDSKLTALNTGADDYIVKPFNMEELIARVNAVIRRNYPLKKDDKSFLKIGKYKVNKTSRTCECNIGNVSLSEKEIKLLEYFVNNKGKILSRSDILEEVWGMDSDPTPRTIDNFILKFRKLFELDQTRSKLFLTIRNKGYLFKS